MMWSILIVTFGASKLPPIICLYVDFFFKTKSRNLVLVSESGDNGRRVSLDSNGDFCYMLSPGEYSISVRGVAYY